MARKTKLDLPDFAFLDGNDGEKDNLDGRNVLLHLRSMSVIEIFEADKVLLKPGTLQREFTYINSLGIDEHLIAAVHICLTVDDEDDVFEEILTPAIRWYCNYLDHEDKAIFEGEIAKLN